MSDVSLASYGVAFTETPGEAFMSRSRNQGEQTRENSYPTNWSFYNLLFFSLVSGAGKLNKIYTPLQPTIKCRFI